MLSYSKVAQNIATANQLENVDLGRWVFMIAIIPFIHILFGILYFYRLLNKNISKKTNELYQIYSIQTACTLLMVMLWIPWSVLQLLKVGRGGFNILLMALAYELESSVGIISASLSKPTARKSETKKSSKNNLN
jgi:heme/copper-type cytochrome/quinol oxidase subunit 2